MTSLEASFDPELLAVAAGWFGGVNPVWRDGEWLCYDAGTDGIVISGAPDAVSVTMEDAEGRGSGRRLEFKLAGQATEATFYLNAGFQDILDSIHTLSGEPLFGDVRQVQPTGVEHARP